MSDRHPAWCGTGTAPAHRGSTHRAVFCAGKFDVLLYQDPGMPPMLAVYLPDGPARQFPVTSALALAALLNDLRHPQLAVAVLNAFSAAGAA